LAREGGPLRTIGNKAEASILDFRKRDAVKYGAIGGSDGGPVAQIPRQGERSQDRASGF
jgi:hypothetical protein